MIINDVGGASNRLVTVRILSQADSNLNIICEARNRKDSSCGGVSDGRTRYPSSGCFANVCRALFASVAGLANPLVEVLVTPHTAAAKGKGRPSGSPPSLTLPQPWTICQFSIQGSNNGGWSLHSQLKKKECFADKLQGFGNGAQGGGELHWVLFEKILLSMSGNKFARKLKKKTCLQNSVIMQS